MVMGLCLLVYSLAQRQLRHALAQAGEGIKNQVGKLTQASHLTLGIPDFSVRTSGACRWDQADYSSDSTATENPSLFGSRNDALLSTVLAELP
jgi:hypothetical protein